MPRSPRKSSIPKLPTGDKLRAMYKLQMELQCAVQEKAGQPSLEDLPLELRIQLMMTHAFALQAELFEAFQEVGWKPWASKRYVNEPAFHSELVDMFKFFLNMMILSGMTADDLVRGFMRKHEVNYQRLASNYDGVSTKCPVCKREYSDTGVHCQPGVCAYRSQLELTLSA